MGARPDKFYYIRDEEVKKMIHSIALRHGILDDVVNDIIRLQFLFAKHVMLNANKEEVYFPAVRLPYFGMFLVSKNREEYYRNKQKNKDNGNKDKSSAGS